MLIIVLIIPIFLAYLGSRIFKIYKVRRDDLQGKLGYRTALSMKSDYSFAFAHHYFGSMWEYGGVAFAFVSGIMMLLVMGRSFINVSISAAVLILMQLAFIVVSLIFTESALRTRFDEEGNPLNERDRLIEPLLPDVPEEEEESENGEDDGDTSPPDGEDPEDVSEMEELPAEGEESPEGETQEQEFSDNDGMEPSPEGEFPENGMPQEEFEPAEADENVPV